MLEGGVEVGEGEGEGEDEGEGDGDTLRESQFIKYVCKGNIRPLWPKALLSVDSRNGIKLLEESSEPRWGFS